MANIVNNTDFKGRFHVSNWDTATVAAQLNYLVSTYEAVFLRMLLGNAQYTLFKEWYDTAAPRPVNAVWTALLAGGNFEKGSHTHYAPPVKDLILAYLYDKWNRENLSQTVAMGEVNTDSQNASAGTAVYKVVDRWNEMASGCLAVYEYLYDNLGSDYRGSSCDLPEIFRYINRLDL